MISQGKKKGLKRNFEKVFFTFGKPLAAGFGPVFHINASCGPSTGPLPYT